MATLRIMPVPAFDDNYIWVVDDGRAALVVDPGQAAPIIAHLQAHQLALAAIVITHHHADHSGGIAELICAFGGDVPVIGPAEARIAGITRVVADGERVAVAAPALTLDVIAVPGHTSTHLAYLATVDGAPRWLFCGDTLFATGCGRMFEGTAAQMQASLARLAGLPDGVEVCCAHEYTLANIRFAQAVEPGNAALAAWSERAAALRASGVPTLPTTIGAERATNPFLRWDQPDVIAAANRHAADCSEAPPVGAAAVFGVLRRWKDDWRG